MIKRLLRKAAVAALCIVAASVLMLAGCASEDADVPSADKLRESLENALQSFDGSDREVVAALTSSVDEDTLDILGISPLNIAEEVISGLSIDVGDVTMEGDVAIAEVYVTCKDIPSVSQAIQDLASQYSSSTESSVDLVPQLTQKAQTLIESAATRRIGPIYLEYHHTDEGWVLTEESQQRLSAEISKGSISS